MESFGQRDLPNITIRIKDKIYTNICEYWQNYKAIHNSFKPSKWIIDLAILPENLREDLSLNETINIELIEIHRNAETGEDIEKQYYIKYPKVKIIEKQNCINDDLIHYTLIIKGYLQDYKF